MLKTMSCGGGHLEFPIHVTNINFVSGFPIHVTNINFVRDHPVTIHAQFEFSHV
jgi:hypothetical protein